MMSTNKVTSKVKLPKTRSGTLHQFDVVYGRIIIGHGWVFTCGMYGIERPVLIDFKSEPLPEGIYHLQVSDEGLAITSDRIH